MHAQQKYCRIYYYAIVGYQINMDLPGMWIWIVFYVIAFVILLSAILVAAKGIMILVCLILVILVLGINFVTVRNQIKMHAARTEMQRQLVEGFERTPLVDKAIRKNR